MVRRIFILCLAIGIGNPIYSQTKDWIKLFNGNDLEGWIIKNHPDDRGHGFWKVDDGMIVINSIGSTEHDYIWLMTNEEYSDFELKLKFKTSKIPEGNSGIQIRSRYDDTAYWMDGPQIDIHPPLPWRTGFMWDETREVKRWIYPDVPKGEWVNQDMRVKDFPFYFLEDSENWNDLKISVRGYEIKAFLNGIQITNFHDKSLLVDAPHQKYQTGTSGHIALQIHKHSELKMFVKDIYIKKF